MSDERRLNTRRGAPSRITLEDAFDDVLSRIAEGYRVDIIAKGRSMLPFIRSQRDAITLSPLTEESIQPGRIVLVRISRGYAIHRIETIYPGGRIILRGDGNPYQREACIPRQILAEATCVRRGRHLITQGSCLWWCAEHPLPAPRAPLRLPPHAPALGLLAGPLPPLRRLLHLLGCGSLFVS